MKQSMHIILLYLDPGSGAMIVRAFIAGTLCAVVFSKHFVIEKAILLEHTQRVLLLMKKHKLLYLIDRSGL